MYNKQQHNLFIFNDKYGLLRDVLDLLALIYFNLKVNFLYF